jgi:hypothetical protein
MSFWVNFDVIRLQNVIEIRPTEKQKAMTVRTAMAATRTKGMDVRSVSLC